MHGRIQLTKRQRSRHLHTQQQTSVAINNNKRSQRDDEDQDKLIEHPATLTCSPSKRTSRKLVPDESSEHRPAQCTHRARGASVQRRAPAARPPRHPHPGRKPTRGTTTKRKRKKKEKKQKVAAMGGGGGGTERVTGARRSCWCAQAWPGLVCGRLTRSRRHTDAPGARPADVTVAAASLRPSFAKFI